VLTDEDVAYITAGFVPLRDEPPPLERLRTAVDELDALLRPFAPYDRIRFGGPVSRDRYVTALRARFPALRT
jgi:Family of unknown function (DUF6058)